MVDTHEVLVAFHGTTRQNAAAILEHGFRPSNPLAMVRMVAEHLRVDLSLLWDSIELEFTRARQDLDHSFFTTDLQVAESYRLPEPMQDAFRAAHRLAGGDRRLREPWIAEQAQRLLGAGQVLEVRLPWEIVGAHAFGRVVSLAEWREWGEPADLNSFSIPVACLEDLRPSIVSKP
jgi:hypothetical protein